MGPLNLNPDSPSSAVCLKYTHSHSQQVLVLTITVSGATLQGYKTWKNWRKIDHCRHDNSFNASQIRWGVSILNGWLQNLQKIPFLRKQISCTIMHTGGKKKTTSTSKCFVFIWYIWSNEISKNKVGNIFHSVSWLLPHTYDHKTARTFAKNWRNTFAQFNDEGDSGRLLNTTQKNILSQ